MTDYEKTLATMYRAEVKNRTVDDDTVDRKTAIAFVLEKADALYKKGEIEVDVSDLFHATLIKIDERDGAATDDAVRSFAAGQYDLQVDGDPILGMVVTLGRGKRKLWRDFTVDDLTELDRIRYQNVASVKAAYDEWRESFDLLLPRLLAGGTIGALASPEQESA